jgi:two-component system chemotaxis response regulator CheB
VVTEERAIRVLVVDDSAFMRKMVSAILCHHGMEVVAAARDGQEGLEKAQALRPDVITLDVEMPRMDGVEFLTRLMRENPLPVVMLSSLTEAGAEITLRCLELGAVDCLHKPSGAISLDIEKIGHEIVAKVQAAAKVDGRRLRWLARTSVPASAPPPEPMRPAATVGTAPVRVGAAPTATPELGFPGKPAPKPARPLLGSAEPVVVIASSTGGPAALSQVLPKLRGDLPASVVVVQHLPVGFSRPMAMRFDLSCALTVREAQEGDSLRRGEVLIAPAGKHLAFSSAGRVVLNEDPPLWGVRPAADVTLNSAAERFGKRVIAAVLTGMGRDGALGVKAVRHHGGVCYAQDEATCVVFGMPRMANETGAVERLVPLGEIASVIEAAVADRL